MDLRILKERLQADPTDDEVASAVAQLAFGEPTDKQVTRVKKAIEGSIDTALRLVDRIAPGRVIQIVCSQQIFPSAAISPAPPFRPNPPMYESSAPTAGQAILLAMLDAMIQETAGNSQPKIIPIGRSTRPGKSSVA